MKLYYSPGACSLSPHIVLQELGIPIELVKVDLASKKEADGTDYRTHNPKGYVPALQLDNGELLTEGAAIVQYLADRMPEKNLAPANGTLERYRLQEMLNFISSEIHKSFSPLFDAKAVPEWKQAVTERLADRFDLLAKNLEGKDYLFGKQFTVADAYLFTVLNWTNFVGYNTAKWPVLQAFMARVASRPAVQATLKTEGLA